MELGRIGETGHVVNDRNFPPGPVEAGESDPVFEVPNPFPFRGATFILKPWADRAAQDPGSIGLPDPPEMSLTSAIGEVFGKPSESPDIDRLFERLPAAIRLAVATNGTDPRELVLLAKSACRFIHDPDSGKPLGLKFRKDPENRVIPEITDPELFEALANNPCLPDDYKEIMVLRPGVQGESEIVGEWRNGSHAFEYLRRNSYIPWGHYAANMAHDTVRYRLRDLTCADMKAMRHLYYQRTFVRLAHMLNIPVEESRQTLTGDRIEQLRRKILERLRTGDPRQSPCFNATLWGWNFGFDFSPSRYRLHASHQQIHQQFALVPARLATHETDSEPMTPYACGDLIADFIERYRQETGREFFDTYLSAIRNNRRMDGRSDLESSLIIHESHGAMIFVPKAQTSQWEIQLMTVEPVGNILEANPELRAALDFAMLLAMRILARLGARMVTVIEYSKRLDAGISDQRLLYNFLPRLPQSPGAFSEAQLRWILGHYPEDFAAACRNTLPGILESLTP
jgi:hypothetical protein